MSLMDMLVAGSIEEQKKKQKKDKTEKPKQQDKKPIKAAAKQNGETKKEKKPAAKKADNNKYKYPFRLQYANQYLDLSGIFDDGQEYTAVEICKLMLQHGYFSFSAEQTSFDFRPAENVLVAYGKQYKKG